MFNLQAKIVVLGDHKTGKSSLIHNIDPYTKIGKIDSGVVNHEEVLFSVIEFPVAELVDNDAPKKTKEPKTSSYANDVDESVVFLKIWEHSRSAKPEEEELAYRGALICIITLDLRNLESARSALTHWVQIKEKFMIESFLFIVGTFLDYNAHRRVEIAEMCKACSQKEALYVEVSNFDGTNIQLLRTLIAHRLQYMIDVRESIASSELERKEEEEALDDRHDKQLSQEAPLATPFYETDLLYDSVGSILSSSLGTHYWPGYANEQAALENIGKKLTGYLDKLANDPKSLPKHPEENYLGDNKLPRLTETGYALYDEEEEADIDMDDLKNVFDIMGFSLPQTMLLSDYNSPVASEGARSERWNQEARGEGSGVRTSETDEASALMAYGASVSDTPPVKMKVRLQDGSTAYMCLYREYEVPLQVDAFLMQYGMEDDSDAREKLLVAAESSLQKAQGSSSEKMIEIPTSPPNSKTLLSREHKPIVPSAFATPKREVDKEGSAGLSKTRGVATSAVKLVTKKCKVRIQLPEFHNRSIDIVVKPGDDLASVAERVGQQYGLSDGYRQKVYDQLRKAFPNL